MKLTHAHLAFWQAMKGYPSWAKGMTRPPSAPSVHELINSQCTRDWRRTEVQNTLWLARARMARGMSPMDALRMNNCPASPRRFHDCAKWIARIDEQIRERT